MERALTLLSVDETGADFPVIPIMKGGTGATTAGTARTALGVPVLPAAVTQADAEAGVISALQLWSPERVAQAIAALAPVGGGGGITLNQAVDGAGALIAVLSQFTYDSVNNVLVFTPDLVNVVVQRTDNTMYLRARYGQDVTTFGELNPFPIASTTLAGALSAADKVRIDGAALLAGATFTGAAKGVTPVDNEDFTTKAYVDGLIITPTHMAEQYLAVRGDESFVATDFTSLTTGAAYGTNSHTATVPSSGLTGAYLAIARLDSDPDLVYLDINSGGINLLGSFTKQNTTITILGEVYKWWLSNNTGTWDDLMVQAR